jgi:Leucine-rich repeat (LRR) protein
VTSTNGSHNLSLSHADVLGFHSWNKTINFMPRGLIDVFPNLILIDIGTAGMKEIHQSDLKDFPRLKDLYLFNNDITTIEQDLFKFNTELELIELGHNKITQIYPTVFDHLSQLSRLWLWSNECINHHAFNRSAVESLIKRVKQKCRGDLNLIDEEDGSKSAP